MHSQEDARHELCKGKTVLCPTKPSRPEQEKLCRFIENRNRKKYPFLPDYLLAACEALEENEMGSAVHDGLEESMEWIRKELAIIISEIRQHTGK